jgi:DNA-binding protein YbaB
MDIQQIMKKAQDLQTKMEKAQNTMKDQKIPGTAAGGGVKVTLTGQGKAHEIQIMWDTVKSSKIFSDAFIEAMEGNFQEDFAMLLDLIIAGFNNAKDKLDGAVTEIMKSLGLSPDMFNEDLKD